MKFTSKEKVTSAKSNIHVGTYFLPRGQGAELARSSGSGWRIASACEYLSLRPLEARFMWILPENNSFGRSITPNKPELRYSKPAFELGDMISNGWCSQEWMIITYCDTLDSEMKKKNTAEYTSLPLESWLPSTSFNTNNNNNINIIIAGCKI